MTEIPTGKVSTFSFDKLRFRLKKKYSSFQGGQIKNRLKKWKALTSDKEIIQTVKGAKINFVHAVEDDFCFQASEFSEKKSLNFLTGA